MNKPNIFRRIFSKRDKTGDISNLKNPKQWFLDALGMRKSLTGVNVTETTAMNYSAIYACVRIISETIASLPLNVYKRLDKGKEKATGHPLYKPLHLKPNVDMTSFSWRELMGVHLNTWGNSYNIKLKNSTGSVIGFYPLIPDKMDVEVKNNEIIYRYTFPDNIQRTIPRRDMLHIPGLSFNGIIGKSPITMAREAIGLGLALEEFGARFFSNSTNIGAVAQHPGKLTEQGSKNLRDSINEVYQGLGNAHKLMLLEEGMKIEKITIPPNDAQFIESRRFQLEEIARIFRVPKHLLQDLINATFSNIEHQSIDFVVHTIRPWLIRIEQGFNSDPDLFDDEYFCEFVVDGLLRGDVQARFEAYAKAFNTGVYSPNDILEMENKNPYPGGDKHFVQLNMQTVEDVGKLTDGSRELIINGNEVRIIPKEAEAIDGRVLETEIRGLNPKLAEKLGKAYSPLFLNALIRITKREKTDLFKISKSYFENKDSEKLKNSLKDFFSKHGKFVLSQIKPPVYAFTEALGADLEEQDITIFADKYSNDFTERYIGDISENIKTIGSVDFEETYSGLLKDRPEELSNSEIKRIQKAIDKYREKIYGTG